ncbi:hypothetical protein [Mesobacillus sp.]|uniref:hypothetical protein n=1 Tax=Mesobacillus sp. TaxID=2675271 RepID=UPI0039EEB2ED
MTKEENHSIEESTSQEENLTIEERLLDLRKKLNKESIHSSLRPKLIGGLNEKDVLKYIDVIENKYQHIEQEMKKSLYELVSARDRLQKELEADKAAALEEKQNMQASLDQTQKDLAVYAAKCEELEFTIQSLNDNNNTLIDQLQTENSRLALERKELESQLTASRQEIAELKEFTAEFEQRNQILELKINELREELERNPSGENQEYVEKIKSLEETIEQYKAEIEEHRKTRARTEDELKLKKAQVTSCKITGFKDEVFNIYQQLEALTQEQVQINKELQEQLKFEQVRAEKAEQRVESLNIWIAQLKEKLYGEQSLFEIQFKKMAERYSLFQSEVNESFDDLKTQESAIDSPGYQEELVEV